MIQSKARILKSFLHEADIVREYNNKAISTVNMSDRRSDTVESSEVELKFEI